MLSNPRKKDGTEKIKVRPLLKKGELLFQVESFRGKQAFHENQILAPVLKYGLIRERMAALVTDALRAEYLEREGYQVQVLEFIDMEHTPKNILIRAVKGGRRGENQDAIRACEEFLHVSPTLGRLLDHKGE